MSARVRLASTEDARAWNELVDMSPDSSYGHTWEWIELSGRHLPGRSLRLVVEENGELVAAFEGVVEQAAYGGVRRLLGQSEFRSPPELTWGYGGPLMLVETKGDEGGALVTSMEREARAHGAARAWVAPFSKRVASLLVDLGYETRERLTSVVSLEGSPESTRARINASFRRRVRKAESLGLEFASGRGPQGLDAFFACLKPLATRKGFPLPPDAFFVDLLQIRSKRIQPTWHVVRNSRGDVLAASVVIGHKRTVTERWAAATHEGKASMANHLRSWCALEWARDEGFDSYDLGGLPSDPASGIYQFKKALGGSTIPVPWHVKFLRFRRTARILLRARGRR